MAIKTNNSKSDSKTNKADGFLNQVKIVLKNGTEANIKLTIPLFKTDPTHALLLEKIKQDPDFRVTLTATPYEVTDEVKEAKFTLDDI